jgi:hypothetical protein
MGVPTNATYAEAQNAQPVKPRYCEAEQDAFEEDEE